jgi:hypothetical protein
VVSRLLNPAPARVTYRFNGQQVAVSEGVTLTFVYGDHLGSASVTANLTGTKVSEARYYPFGETRYSSGTTLTSKRFPSQEEQVGIGLYDYGARLQHNNLDQGNVSKNPRPWAS